MHYLITGGAGFIGSNLTSRLLLKNHQVTVMDNLSTGTIQNIKQHFGNPNFLFLAQDIIEPIRIKSDYVFNLACPASPIHYMSMPLQTLETCYKGTLNVLQYCESFSIAMLQASTSEIYGDPEVHPQHEEYFGNVNTLGPRAIYDEGKRIAETLCYEFYTKNKCNVHLARIFNTYGPNMCVHDGRVVSEFLVNAIQNKPLIINGDGNTTRSFSYIDDTLNGLLSLSRSKYYNSPFNIGNPEEITLKELACKINVITGSSSGIQYTDYLQNDPRKRKPDIAKASAYLNWSPLISIDDGLERTFEYFKIKLRDLGYCKG
jgi:UDP-glucuronate decarboxylase